GPLDVLSRKLVPQLLFTPSRRWNRPIPPSEEISHFSASLPRSARLYGLSVWTPVSSRLAAGTRGSGIFSYSRRLSYRAPTASIVPRLTSYSWSRLWGVAGAAMTIVVPRDDDGH